MMHVLFNQFHIVCCAHDVIERGTTSFLTQSWGLNEGSEKRFVCEKKVAMNGTKKTYQEVKSFNVRQPVYAGFTSRIHCHVNFANRMTSFVTC